MKPAFAFVLFGAVAMMALPRDAVRAQAPADPCALLTDAEVGGAIGARVSAHRGHGDLTKPDRADCAWTSASPKQQVLLGIGRVASGARVQNGDWVKQMTQFGWTAEVAENTPTLWCARIVEPVKPTVQLLPGSGGRCEAVMKGFYFSLDASGPGVGAQQVKALVDKIASRLP